MVQKLIDEILIDTGEQYVVTQDSGAQFFFSAKNMTEHWRPDAKLLTTNI